MKINNSIKHSAVLRILILILSISSCGSNQDSDSNLSPTLLQNEETKTTITISTTGIPNTNAFMTNTDKWTSSVNNNILTFTSNTSSTVTARKSEIKHIASPNQIGLKLYLEELHPERDYQEFEVNGLKGVRANFVNTESKKQADIYLISEIKDFIHITTDLISSEDDYLKGEKIISSVRIKYTGEAVKNSDTKTVVLDEKSWPFSFNKHCSMRTSECNGNNVWTYFDNFNTEMSVNGVNSIIIELGPDSESRFDSTKTNGEFIETSVERILISSLNSSFNQKGHTKAGNRIKIKSGYVYVIRTVNWPNEDVITKFKIDSIKEDKITITYSKLLELSKKNLNQQLAILNKNTSESAEALDEGEITLMADNGFTFKDWTAKPHDTSYDYCDFELQYSKLTTCDSDSRGEIAEIFKLENKDFSNLTKDDFPNPTSFSPGKNQDVEVEVGKTYGIYRHTNSEKTGAVYGVIQVNKVDENNKWVRLKFRRIYSGKSERFQNWQSHDVTPEPWNELLLENDVYYYPGGGPANQGNGIVFSPFDDILSIESNPYGNERGFYNFGNKVDFHRITKQDVESKSNQMVNLIDIRVGDVIGIFTENYFYKNILLIKITAHTRGMSVNFDTKYFYSATAIYEGEK